MSKSSLKLMCLIFWGFLLPKVEFEVEPLMKNDPQGEAPNLVNNCLNLRCLISKCPYSFIPGHVTICAL